MPQQFTRPSIARPDLIANPKNECKDDASQNVALKSTPIASILLILVPPPPSITPAYIPWKINPHACDWGRVISLSMCKHKQSWVLGLMVNSERIWKYVSISVRARKASALCNIGDCKVGELLWIGKQHKIFQNEISNQTWIRIQQDRKIT